MKPETKEQRQMTPEQKDLVQASFEKVKPIADTAAALFYGRLFNLDPNKNVFISCDVACSTRSLLLAVL